MTYTCAVIPKSSSLVKQTRELRLSLEALRSVYTTVTKRETSKMEVRNFDCQDCKSFYDSKVTEFELRFYGQNL